MAALRVILDCQSGASGVFNNGNVVGMRSAFIGLGAIAASLISSARSNWGTMTTPPFAYWPRFLVSPRSATPNDVGYGPEADLERPRRLGQLLSNELTLRSRAFTSAMGQFRPYGTATCGRAFL